VPPYLLLVPRLKMSEVIALLSPVYLHVVDNENFTFLSCRQHR
jgi:hypothetical protein